MTHKTQPRRDRLGARALAGVTALLIAGFTVSGVIAAHRAEAAEYGSNWKFQRVTVPGVTLPLKLSKVGDVERVVTAVGDGPYKAAYANGINIGKPNATDGEAGKPLAGKFGTLEGMGFAGYAAADGGTWTGVGEGGLRTDAVRYHKFSSRGFKYGSLVGNASGKDIIAIEIIVTKAGDTLAEPPAADGLKFKIDRDGACGPHRLTITFDKDKPLKPNEFIWMAMPKFDEDAGIQGAFIPKPDMAPKKREAPVAGMAAAAIGDVAPNRGLPASDRITPTTADPTSPPPADPTSPPTPDPTSPPTPDPTSLPTVDPTPPTDTCPPWDEEAGDLIEI